MPELPEVEVTRRFLAAKIKGQRIRKVVVLSPKQFIGSPQEVVGRRVTGVSRRAKILIWRLEGGISLLIHLKLTGQIVYAIRLVKGKAVFGRPIPFAGGRTLPGRSTRIIVFLSRGVIFFNDLRKFGWMKVERQSRGRERQDGSAGGILAGLGIEPLSKQFTPKALGEILAGSRRAVKLVLMDQSKIAGLGNIYANEALWWAKINPRQPANQVKRIKPLWQAIRKVLRAGIKYGGASAADDAYVKPDGGAGSYQRRLRVYQRAGQACCRCGRKIVRITLGGRGTFFCPYCQKG